MKTIPFLDRVLMLSIYLPFLALCLFGKTDISLAWTEQQGYTLPYGILWFWTNPFHTTDFPYRMFLLGVVTALFILYYQLIKREKLRFGIVYFWMMTNVLFMVMHAPQDISVIFLAPLITLGQWWSAYFLSWEFFTKVPDPSSASWACASGNPVIYNGVALCGQFKNDLANLTSPITILNFIVYAMLGAWLIIPAILWWKKR